MSDPFGKTLTGGISIGLLDVDIEGDAHIGGDLTVNGTITGGTVVYSNSTFGNINITGNTISTVNTNGNIILQPNGTGEVLVPPPIPGSSDAATAAYVDAAVIGAGVGNSLHISGPGLQEGTVTTTDDTSSSQAQIRTVAVTSTTLHGSGSTTHSTHPKRGYAEVTSGDGYDITFPPTKNVRLLSGTSQVGVVTDTGFQGPLGVTTPDIATFTTSSTISVSDAVHTMKSLTATTAELIAFRDNAGVQLAIVGTANSTNANTNYRNNLFLQAKNSLIMNGGDLLFGNHFVLGATGKVTISNGIEGTPIGSVTSAAGTFSAINLIGSSVAQLFMRATSSSGAAIELFNSDTGGFIAVVGTVNIGHPSVAFRNNWFVQAQNQVVLSAGNSTAGHLFVNTDGTVSIPAGYNGPIGLATPNTGVFSGFTLTKPSGAMNGVIRTSDVNASATLEFRNEANSFEAVMGTVNSGHPSVAFRNNFFVQALNKIVLSANNSTAGHLFVNTDGTVAAPAGFIGPITGPSTSTDLAVSGTSTFKNPINESGSRSLIYYADFGNGINGIVWDGYGDAIAAELAYWDFLVIADGLEHPAQTNYARNKSIIAKTLQINPNMKIFGYIDLGVTGGTQNLSTSTIQSYAVEWQTFGINGGIFLDDYGYDFGVDRARQTTVVNAIHGLTSVQGTPFQVVANAFNPDDAFGQLVVYSTQPSNATFSLVNAYGTALATIAAGSYTGTTFATAVQTALNAAAATLPTVILYTVAYSSSTGKLTFTAVSGGTLTGWALKILNPTSAAVVAETGLNSAIKLLGLNESGQQFDGGTAIIVGDRECLGVSEFFSHTVFNSTGAASPLNGNDFWLWESSVVNTEAYASYDPVTSQYVIPNTTAKGITLIYSDPTLSSGTANMTAGSYSASGFAAQLQTAINAAHTFADGRSIKVQYDSDVERFVIFTSSADSTFDVLQNDNSVHYNGGYQTAGDIYTYSTRIQKYQCHGAAQLWMSGQLTQNTSPQARRHFFGSLETAARIFGARCYNLDALAYSATATQFNAIAPKFDHVHYENSSWKFPQWNFDGRRQWTSNNKGQQLTLFVNANTNGTTSILGPYYSAFSQPDEPQTKNILPYKDLGINVGSATSRIAEMHTQDTYLYQNSYSTTGSSVNFYKSRLSGPASTNDELGKTLFNGYDTSGNARNGASIISYQTALGSNWVNANLVTSANAVYWHTIDNSTGNVIQPFYLSGLYANTISPIFFSGLKSAAWYTDLSGAPQSIGPGLYNYILSDTNWGKSGGPSDTIFLKDSNLTGNVYSIYLNFTLGVGASTEFYVYIVDSTGTPVVNGLIFTKQYQNAPLTGGSDTITIKTEYISDAGTAKYIRVVIGQLQLLTTNTISGFFGTMRITNKY